MDPTLAEYIGFVVAALILIWAILEFRLRYTRTHSRPSRKKVPEQPMKNWVKLDPSQSQDELAEGVQLVEEEEDVKPDIQTRAKQNGHYTGSKKPF